MFTATRHLARQLALLTGVRRVLVVLADPRNGSELDRYSLGAVLANADGDALLSLVLPAEAAVCAVNRLHEPSLRRLAERWGRERMLIAPCTFGNELVALALAPVGEDVPAAIVEREAGRLTERFAASVVGSRLFARAV
ncbi:MAG TPA: hypothetical protein VKD67_10360 [Acidimicrobiales bacterium]|nr:hypothetical protein [Acidimicrobiales bacterium]